MATAKVGRCTTLRAISVVTPPGRAPDRRERSKRDGSFRHQTIETEAYEAPAQLLGRSC
jgi:hypothetical protein